MSQENVELVRVLLEAVVVGLKDLEFEIEDVRDGGDEVVALIRNQRQWGRHSGIATDNPDQEAALEAAGLRWR